VRNEHILSTRRDRILGFSALQLGQAGVPLPLASLVSAGTVNPGGDGKAPYEFPLPESTLRPGALSAGFGYLHANCGHCHNDWVRQDHDDRATANAAMGNHFLIWRLAVEDVRGDLALMTPFRRSVNQDIRSGTRQKLTMAKPAVPNAESYTTILVPGSPETSEFVARMRARGTQPEGGNYEPSSAQMPPVATKTIHDEGLTTVETLICALADVVPADLRNEALSKRSTSPRCRELGY
jgi:hypothetical protein